MPFTGVIDKATITVVKGLQAFRVLIFRIIYQ
jgi:hypothetical protein